MMMMTTKERDELDRLEAKNSRNSIHFLTVAEMTRLLWLRDKTMTTKKPYRYVPLTEYQLSRVNAVLKVRCDVCSVWAFADDIVWRGPDGTRAVCDECEPKGDDNQ